MDIIAEQLGVSVPTGNYEELFEPENTINGFGFNWTPILADENPERIRLAKWWLMPSWEKQWNSKIRNTLNTRIEKIDEPRSICSKYAKNHALMLVDGFYEWQHIGMLNQHGKKDIRKERHLIMKPKGSVFQLACLYSNWYFPDVDATIKTVSVLTRPANKLMAHIHNSKKRMPVILENEMAGHWLSGDLEVKDILEMDAYFEDLDLVAYRK